MHGMVCGRPEEEVDEAGDPVMLARSVATEHDEGVGCGLVGHDRSGRALHGHELTAFSQAHLG